VTPAEMVFDIRKDVVGEIKLLTLNAMSVSEDNFIMLNGRHC
jgi:hypothetical protein